MARFVQEVLIFIDKVLLEFSWRFTEVFNTYGLFSVRIAMALHLYIEE